MDLDDLIEESKDENPSPQQQSEQNSHAEKFGFLTVLDGDESLFKKSLYLASMTGGGKLRPSPHDFDYSNQKN